VRSKLNVFLAVPSVLAILLILSGRSLAQTKEVNVVIDASKIGAPISRHIYGQFLEHGGDIVNSGVWAELLADRKFFYPVGSKAPQPPPVMANGAGNPRFNRPIARWWSPIGGEDVVTMDAKDRYAGDHSPEVKLDKTQPHGIVQGGIAVRKDKGYAGRIVLAGSPGTTVKVSLILGNGAADHQTVTIPALSAAYRKFPLHFTAKGDSDDAKIEITGTGSGSFHIGAV